MGTSRRGVPGKEDNVRKSRNSNDLKEKNGKGARKHKSVVRPSCLDLVRSILVVLVLHEKIQGLDPRHSLAGALLDGMLAEADNGKKSVDLVTNVIGWDLLQGIPVLTLLKFQVEMAKSYVPSNARNGTTGPRANQRWGA